MLNNLLNLALKLQENLLTLAVHRTQCAHRHKLVSTVLVSTHAEARTHVVHWQSAPL